MANTTDKIITYGVPAGYGYIKSGLGYYWPVRLVENEQGYEVLRDERGFVEVYILSRKNCIDYIKQVMRSNKMVTTTKITPAQQVIINKIRAGFRLTVYYTCYPTMPAYDSYHSAGFDGNYRGAPVKTVLAMLSKGLIEEVSRKESDYSHTTYVIEYQLTEEK